MSAEARSAIAHALGLLGTAHARLGQRELAEEIQRLGIQWASDGPRAPELFFRLGETLLDEGRGGEAIGFLRRALALARAILDDGDAERRALEVAARLALARAFEERERYAAALSSLERARSLGASSEALATVGARSRRALGASWEAVRAYLDAPAAPPKDAT